MTFTLMYEMTFPNFMGKVVAVHNEELSCSIASYLIVTKMGHEMRLDVTEMGCLIMLTKLWDSISRLFTGNKPTSVSDLQTVRQSLASYVWLLYHL